MAFCRQNTLREMHLTVGRERAQVREGDVGQSDHRIECHERFGKEISLAVEVEAPLVKHHHLDLQV